MNETLEDKPTAIEDLYDKIKTYGETRFALLKLQAINRASSFFSTFVTMLILMLMLFTVILCVSIGAALWIGELIGAAHYGFFMVAGFYIIVGLIMYASRGNLLKAPVSNKLIKEMVE